MVVVVFEVFQKLHSPLSLFFFLKSIKMTQEKPNINFNDLILLAYKF